MDTLFDFNEDKSNLKSFNDIKDYLIGQMTKIKDKFPQKKLIYFFDSLDQLDSSDFNIQWLLKEFPSNVKIVVSTLDNYANILNTFQQHFIDKEENFLKCSNLKENVSIKILDEWLQKSNRCLTYEQKDIIEQIFNKKAILFPLYLKLIFDIVSKWTSFYVPDEDFRLKCYNIDKCIKYLFKTFENKHGFALFSRCCLYLNLFKNGISENEIEDILSIDDDVLSSVLKYHHPPRRRFPFYLWILIKNDIKEYLIIKESEDTKVITW